MDCPKCNCVVDEVLPNASKLHRAVGKEYQCPYCKAIFKVKGSEYYAEGEAGLEMFYWADRVWNS